MAIFGLSEKKTWFCSSSLGVELYTINIFMKILELLLEDRTEFLRDKYLPLIKSKLSGFQIPADIRIAIERTQGETKEERLFNWLQTLDPTRNKQYLQWILGCAVDRLVPFEDIAYLRESLADYHERKRTNSLPIEARDINRIKTPSQLDKLLRKVEDSKASADEAEAAAARNQSSILLDNTEWLVLIPKTEFAAQFWGRNTEWCTAWGDPRGRHPTRSCRFNEYNRRGPLYILIPKNQDSRNAGEMYQFQFTTGQYMDENDEAISIVEFMQEKYRELGKWLLSRPDVAQELEIRISFAPAKVLETICEKVYELVDQNFLMDLLTKWESDDNSYWDWLNSEGFVDEEGNVDWDQAPSYLEYNDEARHTFSRIESSIKMDAKQIRDAAEDYSNENGEDPTVRSLEYVLAHNVRKHLSRHQRYIADWIEIHLDIDYTPGETPKVSVL